MATRKLVRLCCPQLNKYYYKIKHNSRMFLNVQLLGNMDFEKGMGKYLYSFKKTMLGIEYSVWRPSTNVNNLRKNGGQFGVKFDNLRK